MILDDLTTTPSAFSAGTGWKIEPRGLCQGDICVPAPDAVRGDGSVDVVAVAERLGMPLVHDADHGLWSLGPATLSGHALATAVAPDVPLVSFDGTPFTLSSLRGRKVILAAWASY
ncbi:MAG: hypothetical protein ACKOA6_07025 [Actinomycetota bacterium]